MERLWRRNWEFPINKELLIIATRESGLDQRLLESRDEAGMNSPLYSIAMGTAHHYPGTQVGYSVDVLAKQAQYEAVQNVARKVGCVVAGRCANYILRDRINLVCIFIAAERNDRVAHICQRDNVDSKEARRKMLWIDKECSMYYCCNPATVGKCGQLDLCINTSKVGVDGSVKPIKSFVPDSQSHQ